MTIFRFRKEVRARLERLEQQARATCHVCRDLPAAITCFVWPGTAEPPFELGGEEWDAVGSRCPACKRAPALKTIELSTPSTAVGATAATTEEK